MSRGPGGHGPPLSSRGKVKEVEEGARRRRAPSLMEEGSRRTRGEPGGQGEDQEEGGPRLLESPQPHRGGGR